MASPHKPLSRRLSEVLEEQQEPFFLDNVQSERTTQSRAAFLCWRLSDRCFWRKRGGAWRSCLPSKFGCWDVVKRALNWTDTAPPHYRRLGLSDCFPEVRSKRHVGGPRGELNRGIGWKECELSPVSVLDLYPDEDSSARNRSSPVEVEEEEQSTSGLNSCVEDGSGGFTLPPPFEEAKREVPPPSRETTSGDKTEEGTWSWESQWGDLALITNLISLDFYGSRQQDWSRFQDQRSELRVQIEGLIMEELSEECVLDMLCFHCTMLRRR